MDTDYEGELFIDNKLNQKPRWSRAGQSAKWKNRFCISIPLFVAGIYPTRNVMLPGLKLAKYTEEEIEHRAMQHLKTLGIDDQANKNANRLSGTKASSGHCQYSLMIHWLLWAMNLPENLDSKNSQIVFDIFSEIASQKNQSLRIVTHDEDLLSYRSGDSWWMNPNCSISQYPYE